MTGNLETWVLALVLGATLPAAAGPGSAPRPPEPTRSGPDRVAASEPAAEAHQGRRSPSGAPREEGSGRPDRGHPHRDAGREAPHRKAGYSGPSEGAGHEDEGEPERVRLPPDVLEEFGVEVAEAGPGRIVSEVALPAEVRPNQDRVAHIAPRFPGIVVEVLANIGDRVRAGQVLARVESDVLAPFPLKTLIDGVVLEKHITRGEPVSRDRVAFMVADLRDVWVDISVYQKDLADVAVGQPVRISVGHGLVESRGVISYLSPTLDEETRTATARVVVPNEEGRLRPGLFAVAWVRTRDVEVPLAVPRNAVQEIDGRSVIFVERPGGFEPQPVELGRQDTEWVEILTGLDPGDRYVAAGAFTLKAELARESFSGGHGH